MFFYYIISSHYVTYKHSSEFGNSFFLSKHDTIFKLICCSMVYHDKRKRRSLLYFRWKTSWESILNVPFLSTTYLFIQGSLFCRLIPSEFDTSVKINKEYQMTKGQLLLFFIIPCLEHSISSKAMWDFLWLFSMLVTSWTNCSLIVWVVSEHFISIVLNARNF